MPAKREVSGRIAVPVTEVDAIVFDGKYLFDARHEAALTQKIRGSYLVHLDGNQRDRLHVSSALLAAFPGLASVAGLVRSKKLAVIDFAFYVLHGNAVEDGRVVVPINQQMTDVRAENLALMPGNDRKAYRSTEVVPMDGLFIDDAFRFLPRTVTIIHSPNQADGYQFKVSPIGGDIVKFGFERARARQVFYSSVLPRLVAGDAAGFASKNVKYQALCASYFATFPHGRDRDDPPESNRHDSPVAEHVDAADAADADVTIQGDNINYDAVTSELTGSPGINYIVFDVEKLSDGIIVSKGRYTGNLFNRAVLVDGRWVVMKCNQAVVVIDVADYESLKDNVWTMNLHGYVVTRNDDDYVYMHRVLVPDSETVDHINWITTDNRRANLRAASQSEQNHNRFTRSDKIPACAELRAVGIDRLPRGMRKDNSIGRYTCQDHAACRSKPANGTRHGSDEVAQFKHCLELYIEALSSDESCARESKLGETRITLAHEYNTIVKSAHRFDAAIPDGPYVDVEDHVDDLTYAKQLMSKVANVTVVQGPRNIEWRDVAQPNGLLLVVGRVKGRTLTLYDERFARALSGINWDVDGSAPRANKIPLSMYVWKQLAGREIPDGHVVGAISRRPFDVRLENLELFAGRQGFRGSDGDWVLPEEVNATRLGMRFLPKGLTVNSAKVMISQAGRLIPGEHGADDRGLWSRTISRGRHNVKELVREAVACLERTHGRESFLAANATYQRLLGEYVDAVDVVMV